MASATVRLHARRRSDAPEAPDHRALREAREDLARSLRQRDQLRAELQLLEGIPMPARPRPVEGQPPPPSPLQARLAFDRFIDGETRERHEALAALAQAIDRLQHRVAELEDQIRRHQGSNAARPDELSKSVHVDLHASGVGDERILLLLRYQVPACRWVPRYALRLDGSDARLELRAAVAQGSGEDWEGVELTLSTAIPQAYSPLPALAAAHIGNAQPPPTPRPQRPAPQGADALYADADRALAALPRPAQPLSRVVHALTLESLEDAIDAVMDESDDTDSFAARSSAFGSAAPGAVAASAMEMDMPMAEPAPAMAPPPSPEAARSRTKKKGRPQPRETSKMAKEEGEEEGEEEAPMAPATGGWPDYGSLVLPAPFGAGRGRLAPLSAEDKLTTALVDAGVSLPFDVGSLLRQHATRAQRVARLALPAGARAVRPSHFDHAVRASHPVDVPSVGTWHTVTLA